MLYSGTTMLMSGPAGWLAACFTSSSGVAKRSAGMALPGNSFLYSRLAFAWAITPEMPTRRSVARKTNSGKVCHSWRHLLTRYRMGQVSFQNWDWTTLFSVFSRSCSWLRLSERSLRRRSSWRPCSSPVRSASSMRSRRMSSSSSYPASCPAASGASVRQNRAVCKARPRLCHEKSRYRPCCASCFAQAASIVSSLHTSSTRSASCCGRVTHSGSTTTRSSGRAPSAGCTAPVASSALSSAPTPPSTCTLQGPSSRRMRCASSRLRSDSFRVNFS